MKAKKKAKKRTRVAKSRTKKASRKSTRTKSSRRKTAPKRATKRGSRNAKSARKRQGKKRTTDLSFAATRRVEPLLGDADSQGLSETERADSESVGELLEEGNAFEAGVVRGVERAEDSNEREVRTREFPEDDVPEEYLDKD
jgi:hypothetical protein